MHEYNLKLHGNVRVNFNDSRKIFHIQGLNLVSTKSITVFFAMLTMLKKFVPCSHKPTISAGKGEYLP